MRKYWYILLTLLVAADQGAKWWAVDVLRNSPDGSLPFLNGLVGWRYAENTGAAFSALAGRTTLLAVASVLLVVLVLAYLIFGKNLNGGYHTGLVMIAAGGIGNMVDRIFRGYVVDYIELQFMRFAIFNFADVCITLGAGLVLIMLLVTKGESNGKKRVVD